MSIVKGKLNQSIVELLNFKSEQVKEPSDILKVLYDTQNMNTLILPVILASDKHKMIDIEEGNNIWKQIVSNCIESNKIDINMLNTIATTPPMDFALASDELKIEKDEHIVGLLVNMYGDKLNPQIGFDYDLEKKIIELYDRNNDGIITKQELNIEHFDLELQNFKDIEVNVDTYPDFESLELDIQDV
ncbi:hypothetical protein RZE82_07845 [Mollicutes bacterium LVI A0039]|nr:hypothetical protein RZE82_07845 [Mollicutes bacterium LVI A0039]